VLCLEAGQIPRHVCFCEPVAAILSDRQTPAEGVERPDGICVAERKAVRTERVREQERVARWLGRLDQPTRGNYRFLTRTGEHERPSQACLDVDIGVAAALEPGAAHLDPPLGLAAEQIRTSKHAFEAVWQRIAAPRENDLPRVAVWTASSIRPVV
jgi:hypothetical protein